jgi:hypothetical protein
MRVSVKYRFVTINVIAGVPQEEGNMLIKAGTAVKKGDVVRTETPIFTAQVCVYIYVCVCMCQSMWFYVRVGV